MSENPFDKDSGNPAISFATRDDMGNLISLPKGTKIGGRVVGAPKLVQQRDFSSKSPAFWDPPANTQPKMAVVVDLDVNGETKSLWSKKPSDLFAAINKAMNDTGGAAIAIGDTLVIELVGATQGDDSSKAATKNYVAHLTRGAGAFASETVAAPPAGVPAPPAATPPPPPAPPAAAWAGQAERDAFLAAGWTAEQIAQHHPHLVPPVAVAAATPPPPPAPAAVDARAQALANMSAEDRELLGLNK